MRGSDHKSNFFVACWCFLHVGQYLHSKIFELSAQTKLKSNDKLSSCWETLPWVVFSERLHGCEKLDAFLQSNSGFLFLGLQHALMLLVGLHKTCTQTLFIVCSSCPKAV